MCHDAGRAIKNIVRQRGHEAQVPLAFVEGSAGRLGARRIAADLLLAVDDLAASLGHFGDQEDIALSRSHGRAPTRQHPHLDLSRRPRLQPFPPDRRRRLLDDPGTGGGVAAEHPERVAARIHRDVVAPVVAQVPCPPDHQEGQPVNRRRGPGEQDIAHRAHQAVLVRMVQPLFGGQVVVDGARARIVDQVVDDHPVNAALEQRIALIVVGVEIADDQQARDIVVDQRALGMFALRMARIGQALGDDVVRKGDVVAGAGAPFLRA
jgi:hypothetical protein